MPTYTLVQARGSNALSRLRASQPQRVTAVLQKHTSKALEESVTRSYHLAVTAAYRAARHVRYVAATTCDLVQFFVPTEPQIAFSSGSDYTSRRTLWDENNFCRNAITISRDLSKVLGLSVASVGSIRDEAVTGLPHVPLAVLLDVVEYPDNFPSRYVERDATGSSTSDALCEHIQISEQLMIGLARETRLAVHMFDMPDMNATVTTQIQKERAMGCRCSAAIEAAQDQDRAMADDDNDDDDNDNNAEIADTVDHCNRVADIAMQSVAMVNESKDMLALCNKATMALLCAAAHHLDNLADADADLPAPLFNTLDLLRGQSVYRRLAASMADALDKVDLAQAEFEKLESDIKNATTAQANRQQAH